MTDKNGVSVVIPAYNAQNTIEDAINSVLAQAYPCFELIVVEDCSTDGTLAEIARIKQHHPELIIHNNESNKGVSYNRNLGVSLAKYDWIAFLDSDDTWKLDKLQKQMELLKKTGGDLCYTGYDFMREDGSKFDNVFHVPVSVTYEELLKQNVISCSGILIKKELMQQVKMEKDYLHEDFIAWLRILQKGVIAVGIDEPLHTLRIAVKNSKSGNKFKSAIITYKTYKEIGLSLPKRIYYFAHYVNRSLKKYSQIIWKASIKEHNGKH